MRNIEIKARVPDIALLHSKAQHISGSQGEILIQEDTFFCVANGRLKLREQKGKISQLIHYIRPDQEGPKLSSYSIVDVQNPCEMKALLTAACGVKNIVKKKRYLYMVEQTRVHVDEVENLGNFMELEVVLTDDQSVADGQVIAEHLMQDLGIKKEDLLHGAYADLLNGVALNGNL